MKLTKLTVLAAVGALALSASAKLPSGFESVNVKATVLLDNGAKTVKMKITTDDILSLIDNEFGTSYSKENGGKGYQLVSYGVGYGYIGYDIFAVLDKDGNVVLSNASFSGDEDYYLYLYPYQDRNWVSSGTDPKITYTIPQVGVYYNSGDDEDSFYIYGLMTDKVNWDTDTENYSLKNGQGSLTFFDEEIFGPIMDASVSGKGTDVYPFNSPL